MKYQVSYSQRAIEDLDRIWNEVFYASRESSVAEKYVNDLMDTVELRSDFPYSGVRLFYQNRFTGYFYVIFKSYLAFYRIEKSSIFVDRVLFAKSDYQKILFGISD